MALLTIICFNRAWINAQQAEKMSTDSNNKPPHKRKRQIWRKLFIYLTSIAFVVVAAMMCTYFYMNAQLPDVSKLKDIHLQEPMRILDSQGGLIAQYGEKRRIPLTFQEIPKPLINAVLATEDARFYEHLGVDPVGLARAALVVIKSGRKAQGASTITMQVARNFYLSRKKTFSRKLREMLLALKIDRELPKDTILALYLNKIFFGNRAYGVGAAAAVYYGKPIGELTLAQMAMLAGLPQSPSRNNPIRNPEAALDRRNHVLERMYELHKISHSQYEQAISAPVTAKYHHKQIDLRAGYVASTIRQQMLDQYGDNIYEMGLTVNTSIRAPIQRASRRALQAGLIDYSLRHGYWGPEGHIDDVDTSDLNPVFKPFPKLEQLPLAIVTEVANDHIVAITQTAGPVYIGWKGLRWARRHLEDKQLSAFPRHASDVVRVGDIVRVQQQNNKWRLSQWPKVQGAVIVLNPKTSQVLAMVGGFSFQQSAFNRAMQAKRQPGSSFKPFIYSAALSKGSTLATIINDAPIVLKDSGENQLWRPMNDTRKFYGPTRVRQGLIKSRNLVSIRLLEKTGINYTLNYLQKFGFDSNELAHTLSLALGSAEVTPYQLSRAYTVFANGGYLRDNQLVTAYEYNGNDLIENPIQPKCNLSQLEDDNTDCLKPSITPQNDYLMTSALQDVIQHGTGRAARVLKRHDIAGKTGTTNEQVDAWFAGFNQDVVAIVWVGYDDLRSLKEYGAQAALPIWINVMRQALTGKPQTELNPPSGIVSVRINKKTGQATDASDKSAMFESFREEYAPKADENNHPSATETDNEDNEDNDQTSESGSIF
jgi:penicillin-binding protein 1A